MSPVRIDIPTQSVELPSVRRTESEPDADGESFGQLVKSLIQDVNSLQHDSAGIEKKFLAGEITDVHQVMLAAEEASVAFELLMEIRNKLIESYKEIIRTPA
jgi:flagellar hook-basal body complex protein FliE